MSRRGRIGWGAVAVLALVACLGLFFQRSGPKAFTDLPQDRTQGSERPAAARTSPAAWSAAVPPATPRSVKDSAALAGLARGRVVAADSRQGVAGAEVTFQAGGVAFSVHGDDGGVFAFQPPKPGLYLLAAAGAPGYVPFAPEWGYSPIAFTAVSGQRVDDLVVVLTPRIDYLGSVVAADGKPISGADVRVFDRTGNNALMPDPDRYVTDEKGEFHFHAPDDALLEARAAGYAPGRAAVDFAARVSRRLSLRLGTPAQAAARDFIRGRVTGPKGAVGGARVSAEFEEVRATSASVLHARGLALADADGNFTLSELDRGSYRLEAQAEGYAPVRAEGVKSGTRDVVLSLEAGGGLRGRVRDAATGNPLPVFTLAFERVRKNWGYDLLRSAAIVDAGGAFEVTGLPNGPLDVVVVAPGYAPSKPMRVEIGPEMQERNFDLLPGTHLRGMVRDAKTQAGIPGAQVSLEGWLSQFGGDVPTLAGLQTSAVTDHDGRFELEGLGAGRLSLFVAAEGHHARIASSDIPESGDPPPVEVSLAPLASGEVPSIQLTGIGAVLSGNDQGLVIGQLLPGGGAAEAGLVPGDVIVAVDGSQVDALGPNWVMSIRGPDGTSVTLRIKRASGEVDDVVVWRRLVQG